MMQTQANLANMKLIKIIAFFLYIYSSNVLANRGDSLNKSTRLMLGLGLNASITRSLLGPAWLLGSTEYHVDPIITFNPSIQSVLKINKKLYLNAAFTYHTIGYKERINESLSNTIKDRMIVHRDKFIGSNFNFQYHINSFFVGFGSSFLALIQYKKIEDGKINPYGPRGQNDYSTYGSDYNFVAYSNGLLYSTDFKCGYSFSTKKSFVIVPEFAGSIYRPLDKNFGLFPGLGYFSAGVNLLILYKLK